VESEAARIREQQRAEWNSAAPGWRQRAAEMRGVPGPFVEEMLRLARIAPGHHVLDLASGLGDPAVHIARRVAPGGTVLGLDLTAAMVEGARAEAAEQGLGNVKFRQIASERELGVEAAVFDAATCRHGLMYMPDPAGALAAIRAALKPGGRVAVSTTGWPERNVWLWLTFTIVRRHIALPPLDLDVPGPYALSSPEKLRALLEGAGFTEVEVEAQEYMTPESPSPNAWWEGVTTRTAPIMVALADASDATRQAIRADAIRTLTEMFPSGPIALSGIALLAGGTNPR
jgi:SAM-dependent methyltransferase